MKYKTEVVIDLPRDRVLELFDSTENLYKWQPTLTSHQHLSGEPGQAGAKMQLVYDMNGRVIEMIETITTRNLPDEFSGTYETKGVWNFNENFFYDQGEKTRWVIETEFKCSGMMWLMTTFMPGMFKRETLKQMNSFKVFAEGVEPEV